MPPASTSFDWTLVDVTVPGPSCRLPGVSMAGFRQRVPELPALEKIAMIAHPSVTLLLDLSEHGGLVCAGQGRHWHGSLVVGLAPGDLRSGGQGRADCLQIRLEPAVAAAVLGTPANLTGRVVTLEEVWGRDAARVEDRLRAATSWDERFGIAVEILRRRLDAGPPAVRPRTGPRVDPEVAHIWRRTRLSRGRARVDDLAGEVGWSRKRLWSRFRDQLGITPKRAARLVRFDHAAHLLAAGRPPADAATGSGYADQSHLNREAQEFTGLTPTAVAAAPFLAIDDVAWPG